MEESKLAIERARSAAKACSQAAAIDNIDDAEDSFRPSSTSGTSIFDAPVSQVRNLQRDYLLADVDRRQHLLQLLGSSRYCFT
jgi:hypothetical protein